MSRKPRFLEFFAGAGLVRLGLEPEWECVFANDSSTKKAEVYRANFGSGELAVSDVANLEATDLPDAEMAWASFPCQDLSLAGWRRGMSAPRSGAFWPFWALMRDMHRAGRRPPLIVIENVVGLLYGGDFSGLCEALAAIDMRFGAMVLDAKWFVPQSRPRVFLVAIDENLNVDGLAHDSAESDIWFPSAVKAAAASLPERIVKRWLWWDLPQPRAPRRGRKSTLKTLDEIIDPSPIETSWRTKAEVDRLLAMMTPTNLKKITSRQRAGGRHIGFLYRRTRQGIQRAEVRFDGLAGCIRTPEGGSSRQTVVIVEAGQVRMRLLTPREAARLMGAADTFKLPSRYNDAYRAMGDGVAVPAVRHLSSSLLESLIALGR